MATVTDHEDMTAEIVFAFSDALRVLRTNEYGSDAYENAMEPAFAVALKYGWDHVQDDDFYAWCLKATHEEICVSGMVKALATCHPQKAQP